MASSSIWQADLSRRPQLDGENRPVWELLICAGEPLDARELQPDWQFVRQASQPQITGLWVQQQLAAAIAQQGRPACIQVFRPQSLSLIAAAAEPLGIAVEATRHTPQLKARLRAQAQSRAENQAKNQPDWDPLTIEKLPPQPLPERLRGDRWQFAALPAGEVEFAFRDRPIPIVSAPSFACPIRQGLSSDVLIPGVVIYGGRAAMALARWLQETKPVSVGPVVGSPDGLILEAGLAERWVLATYEDPEVAIAAEMFSQRLEAALGIHFLSIQPDDSGITTSGFWLLRSFRS